MTTIDLSTILLQNPQSPKFASNQPTGGRTLFPLKFTPDVLQSGEEGVGTIISGATYPATCTKGVGVPIAEGTKAYACPIAQGAYQPWGYRRSFPSPKTKGAVINLQWSLFFPSDYNWTVSAEGIRLKFLRIPRRNTEFKYFHCNTMTGVVPEIGTLITHGSGSGYFAGVSDHSLITNTRITSLPTGTTLPPNCTIRLTGTSGVFNTGGFSSAGMVGVCASGLNDGEGYIDIYMENAAGSGVQNDGRLLIETENYGGINNGPLIYSSGNMLKNVWNTVEFRVVLDDVPMSQGGTARMQMWCRVGQQMVLICDVQDTATLNLATSEAYDMILFNYWNGSSPATQTMYLDRVVMHFNPATLVETCPTTGVKIVGGVSP